MAEWVKVGMDVGTGAIAGVADQLIQNQDDKRAAEKEAAGEKLSIMGQYGTYLNYGVPILSILASAMGWLTGDWATRAVLVGSQLAGRKATWQFTKRKELPGYAFTQWNRAAQLEAKRRATLEAARQEAEARARGRAPNPLGNPRPQISEFQIPVVSGGKGLA